MTVVAVVISRKLGPKMGPGAPRGPPGAGATQVRVSGEALAEARQAFNRIRADFWRHEAATNASRYSAEQVADMATGKAPIGADGYRMELHHRTALAEGGTNAFDNLEPMTRTDHRLGSNYKGNHPNLP